MPLSDPNYAVFDAFPLGFDVPYYTETSWDDAAIPEAEVLPVGGGYIEEPWTGKGAPPSRLHLFSVDPPMEIAVTDKRSPPNYDPSQYPTALAELGPGMIPFYLSRAPVNANDACASTLTRVAVGTNLVGYYVYHGGIQPDGELTYTHEGRTPIKNYHFQAPISEYGQIGTKYRRLKLLNSFLQHFGDRLAPMTPFAADRQPSGPSDVSVLRVQARAKGDSAFVFMHNYQHKVTTRDLGPNRLRLGLPSGDLALPERPFTLPAETPIAIWPVHLDLQRVDLVYATATPLAFLDHEGTREIVFFAEKGIPVEYVFDATTVGAIEGVPVSASAESGRRKVVVDVPGVRSRFTVTSPRGQRVGVLTLTRGEAEDLWVGELAGSKRFVLGETGVLFDRGDLALYGPNVEQSSFAVFPPLAGPLYVEGKPLSSARDGVFQRYAIDTALQPATPPLVVKKDAALDPRVSDPTKDMQWICSAPARTHWPSRSAIARVRAGSRPRWL